MSPIEHVWGEFRPSSAKQGTTAKKYGRQKCLSRNGAIQQNVIQSMRRRCQSCIQENGGHYTHSVADPDGGRRGVLNMMQKKNPKFFRRFRMLISFASLSHAIIYVRQK